MESFKQARISVSRKGISQTCFPMLCMVSLGFGKKTQIEGCGISAVEVSGEEHISELLRQKLWILGLSEENWSFMWISWSNL